MSDTSRLRLLQDALMQLKQHNPALKLKKGVSGSPAQQQDSKAGDSKAAAAANPFPINISVSIQAPQSASRYDVEAMGIAMHLSSSILQLPPPTAAVAVKVTNPELPAKLRTVIAKQLHAAWSAAAASAAQDTAGQQDAFALHAVLQHAQQHFVQLLTACPQFIEPYEGVDSNGATQRRFAVVSTSDADDDDAGGPAVPGEPAGIAAAAAAAVPAAAAAAAAQAEAAAVSGDAEAAALNKLAESRHGHTSTKASSASKGASSAPAPRHQPLAAHTVSQHAVDGAIQQQQQQQLQQQDNQAVLSAAATPFQPSVRTAAAATAATPTALSSTQAQAAVGGHPKDHHLQQQQQQQALNAATAALQQLQPPGASMPGSCSSGPGRGQGLGGDSLRGRGRGRGRGREGCTPAAAAGSGPYGGPGVAGDVQQLPGHELAARDLQAAQRRYGRSFRMQHSQQQQQQHQQQQAGALSTGAMQPPPSGQLQAALPLPQDARPQQRQQQQQSLQQQLLQQQQQQALTEPRNFSIMLRPTDPLWGASRGPLHVTGTLTPALYPSTGSLSCEVNPSRGVAAAETWVLQEALNRELQQQAGRAWQLRSVLRWLENYAGSELDRCFKAQQQLFAGEAQTILQQQQQHDPQQQQQQQQQQGRRQGAGTREHQGFAGSRSSKQPQQRAPAAAAAAAPVAHRAPAASSTNAGAIRVIRKIQPQQQQQQPQQEGVDADLGLRLKPLLRNRDIPTAGTSADSWLTAKAASSYAHAPSGSSSSSSAGDSHSQRSFEEDGGSNCDGGSSSSTGSDSDADSDASETPKDELQLHGGAVGDSQGPGGWAVTLEGLNLDNVGVLEVVQASLQLSCSRCSSSTTVLLTAHGGSRVSGTAGAAAAAAAAAAGAAASRASEDSSSSSRAFEWSGSCGICQQELNVLLRPRFVHEGSNVLAGLKAVGCSPLDMLPSVYGATCADCDAVGALRGLQVGVPASRSCGHCHRTISVSIPAVAFVPQGPPTGGKKDSRRAGGAPSRRAKGPGGSGRGAGALVEGASLPHNGTCKHYRHSYRWLRFPCCGARFPCDLCHEEAAADGHDAAWATRMVCGFCSREQPLAPACKHCGKKLATSASKPSGRNTRHWEGGAGCRNMKMLDRRDAAKYRNSKAKTKSAKASRVGPKPWSGTAGGAAAASGTRSA